MPWDFWRLTFREFHLKHAAFLRAEDRTKALMFEHVSVTVPRKSASDQEKLERHVNYLRRYPVKRWLK